MEKKDFFVGLAIVAGLAFAAGVVVELIKIRNCKKAECEAEAEDAAIEAEATEEA